ncbi:hypothetical protein QR680_003662 [Steinernema hermaphroditum]|uniref:Uncharacterized protein n=1 Tax=Steinernema hermaphroditum TaxID=289476 RepID=A0AA39HL49_9BILA|nr:hypothetical protein QR680_003662 [Steinernema hermaphroditum]
MNIALVVLFSIAATGFGYTPYTCIYSQFKWTMNVYRGLCRDSPLYKLPRDYSFDEWSSFAALDVPSMDICHPARHIQHALDVFFNKSGCHYSTHYYSRMDRCRTEAEDDDEAWAEYERCFYAKSDYADSDEERSNERVPRLKTFDPHFHSWTDFKCAWQHYSPFCGHEISRFLCDLMIDQHDYRVKKNGEDGNPDFHKMLDFCEENVV